MKVPLLIVSLALLLVDSAHAQFIALTGTSPYTSPNNFQFQGSGTVIALGAYVGTGATFETSGTDNGTGVKQVWFAGKAAFRAGRIEGTSHPYDNPTTPYLTGKEWDDANIGIYSVAFGSDTVASANGGFACGRFSTASGNEAFAGGNVSLAQADYSVAIGDTNTSYGTSSTTLGSHDTATNSYASAIGSYNAATGYSSIALGRLTIAGGSYSATLGYNISTSSEVCTVVGRYNNDLNADGVTAPNATTWVATDPVFQIGNGSSTTASNALTVYKNGTTLAQGTISAPTFITTANPAAGDIPMFGH